MPPIRIALLGSGIFARDAHLPAIQALGNTYEVVAIYSRNADTAAALAATLPGDVTTYTELEPLLARADIDAIDVVLPIAVQPPAVEAALRAGKHVIGEKPVAPDVAAGRQLIQTGRELTKHFGTTWMVAENIRYEPAYAMAGEIIRRGDIGKPIQVNWITAWVVNEKNKYYHTAWRRNNSFPGGMIVDGGIHNITALRAIMGEVEQVFAFTTQVRADLPPFDTLNASFQFASGALGTWNITLTASSPWEDGMIRIVGEHGAIRVNTQQLEIHTGGETISHKFQVHAIQEEFKDFARAIREGVEPASTPEQALQDLAVLEAILLSAESGRATEPARIVS